MANEVGNNIFGSASMGYLVVGSRKLDEWKLFIHQAMGLHLASESEQALAFRMDDHARRLIIENDPAEDILAIGWQVNSEAALQTIIQRVEAHGVTVTPHTGDQAAARGVAAFHRFVGPKGLLIELFITPVLDDAPLDMLCSGFVTGAAGIGHISLMSREPERTVAFWQSLLDARISDTIDLAVGNRKALDVTFLRVNQRHHSIAIAATKGLSIDMFRTRIQHFNMEAATLNDLIAAYERCKALGFKLSRGIGQHPNDKELSFYVHSPSGFEFEMGWDALTVNEEAWQPGLSYNEMSTWGHEIPGRFSSEFELRHLVNAARSLVRTEYLPW